MCMEASLKDRVLHSNRSFTLIYRRMGFFITCLLLPHLGSILMAMSSSGPRDMPLKKAKAPSMPILLAKLSRVWGVMCRPKIQPREPSTASRPSWNTVMYTHAPTAAVIMVTARHPYTCFRCSRTGFSLKYKARQIFSSNPTHPNVYNL